MLGLSLKQLSLGMLLDQFARTGRPITLTVSNQLALEAGAT